MNISYKIATLDDLQLLIDARVEFMRDYWGDPEQSAELALRNELKKFYLEEIPSGRYVTCLAMDGNQLAGAGAMHLIRRPGSFRVPDGRSAYIMNMYTAPQYRRQGIATTILDNLMEYGKNQGIVLFDLNATEQGEPLYIQYGFKKHGEPAYRLLNLNA